MPSRANFQIRTLALFFSFYTGEGGAPPRARGRIAERILAITIGAFSLDYIGQSPAFILSILSKTIAYFIGSIPRSLHIFLARSSLISECLGTDDLLF